MGDFDIGMMPFQEQIRTFRPIRKMLLTVEKNPPMLKGVGMPWRIYAQKENGGKWRKKDFKRYKDALDFFRANFKNYHDMSITSKRRSFKPPGHWVYVTRGGKRVMRQGKKGEWTYVTRFVTVTAPPGHQWCIYCRRFTVFIWFINHHAFTGTQVHSEPTRRCTVCGVREVTGAWRHHR